MAKLVKKLSLKQGDTSEEFYFDATTGVKGYDYYSTEEMVVGKWIDGKPLYRKIINVTSPSSVGWKSAYTYESEMVIHSISGYIITAIPERIPINFWYNSTANICCFANDLAKDIRIKVDVATYTNRPCVLFLEYTKTTDQPDSFKEETIELTAEHKTGEVYNGKPVYELYINSRSASTANTNTIVPGTEKFVNTHNVETMIKCEGVVVYSKTSSVPFGLYISSNDNCCIWYGGNDGSVYVRHSANYNNQNICVRLKYTKTTD